MYDSTDSDSCLKFGRDDQGDVFIDVIGDCAVVLEPSTVRELAARLIALADAEDADRAAATRKRCDAIAAKIAEGLRDKLNPKDLEFYEDNRYRSTKADRQIDEMNLN